MILTGIADEAGADIEAQIRAHRELGWNELELRTESGKNAAGDLEDERFALVADAIDSADIKVTCFASSIGNWSRRIDGDFEKDVQELKTAIPRMHRLDCTMIRTMSWVGEGVADDAWRDEVLRRYRCLVELATDGGIFLAHENCTGWGGQSAENTRRLHDEIDNEHFVLLFDIGNVTAHGQDSWLFYQQVKDLIRYVHIKDCRNDRPGEISHAFAYPGEGDAQVAKILADLWTGGYRGVVSIEPHIGSIVNPEHPCCTPEDNYRFYLKYGRMAQAILNSIKTGKRN